MCAAKRPLRLRLSRRVAFGAALTLAAAAASACIFGGGSKRVEIPDSVETSSEAYTLLYSTLGYDSAATKHVLIRQNDLEAVPAQGLAFHWRLAGEDGRERASGLAQYGGTAWGIPMWVADFTKVDRPGTYRLVVDVTAGALATPPFRIDDYLYSRATFESVALDNAEQRAAPIDLDDGYFEGNTREGTVAAHAQYLLGLLDAFEHRRFFLTADQHERLMASIQRAVDYILLLADPATGEIRRASSRRPVTDDVQDTPEGLRALARYAVVFQREDAARAQRAYRLARLADEWIQENDELEYPPELRAAVGYDLFLYSNDAPTLEATFAAARTLATDYDVRQRDRRGSDPVAYFETLHRLALDFPDHPDRALWLEAANRNAALYALMLEATPLSIVPSGVAAPDGPSPAQQWDVTADEPPVGEGAQGAISNGWFLARARDAIYIADMTGNHELWDIATASLAWITGLNPGVDSEFVAAPRTGSPVEAASFLLGVSGRTALPWGEWHFQRRAPAGTIIGGFLANFGYDDGVASGESSIVRDGLWLRAVILYEDTLHASGPAAPEPEPAPHPVSEMVVSTEALVEGGAFAFAVTITDVAGDPVPGATVSVAWSAAPDAAISPWDAVIATSCVTTPEGVCTVSLDVGALGPARPITAAVTNVSHSRLRFEPSDGLPAPSEFE